MKSNNNNADLSEGAENLFSETPLIRSEPLTALVGKPVYLKLDALQASGSFKVSSCYYFQRELILIKVLKKSLNNFYNSDFFERSITIKGQRYGSFMCDIPKRGSY